MLSFENTEERLHIIRYTFLKVIHTMCRNNMQHNIVNIILLYYVNNNLSIDPEIYVTCIVFLMLIIWHKSIYMHITKLIKKKV